MNTIGYPGPLFLVAFGDRDQPELPATHREVVWEAVERTLDHGDRPAGEIGVLVGDEGREVLAAAAARGVTRAVAADRPDRSTFELAHGDGFGRHLEASDAQLAKVGLSWNHGHAAEDKKAQALQLSKLAAWLHETDRKLLIDLTVPPVASDLEFVGGDRRRFEVELHPNLVRRAVQEIRDLGIEPDVWITEPVRVAGEAERLEEFAREAGRDEVALLLADDADDEVLRTAAPLTGYRGFVAGRSIWAEPLAALEGRRASRDEAVQAIDEAFRRRLEGFRAATHG